MFSFVLMPLVKYSTFQSVRFGISKALFFRNYIPSHLYQFYTTSPDKGNDDHHSSEKKVKELLENSASFNDVNPNSPDNVWSTSPYPKGVRPRSQASKSLRPRIDPNETSIILFPGQGTQYVGMGKKLLKFPIVKELFEEANEILRYNLLDLCTNGPKENLNKTEFAQPAILVCSLACLERLKEERPSAIENCIATAGFSLGEITALVFAGSFSFQEALELVRIRAEAMQLASEVTPGAMVSILYRPDSKLSEACVKAKEHAEKLGASNPYCGVSNYLFPHGKIIAGNEECIKFLEENKDDFGIKKLKRLPVSGAFHTPHMTPAKEVFREALRKVKVSDPLVAVHSNIDGKLYTNGEEVKRRLPKQIVAPVKWEQILHILYERPKESNFPKTFECGPGSSLSTILKMVNLKASNSCYTVGA